VKIFFHELELWDGLDIDSVAHLWILHHLFLSEINQDAQDWSGAWNSHVVSLRGERARTPQDMFFFGMLEQGVRGIEIEDQDLDEDAIAGYGIDWEALDNQEIRNHHDYANPPLAALLDDEIVPVPHIPQVPNVPSHLAVVDFDEPNCPMTAEQVFYLDSQLATYDFAHSRTAESYRLRWITALALCREMFVI
jgi:hypothetical protein